ncbi:hypothetical protein [Fimbriiglobus ruber]|uniref:Uncharacterized protein n=1 Tax=Fimbriiglobus ruber TaxID=1908690 RepID=A0A225DKC8_9BACT|nr:hypothetical protein [Fimbriiglobus ruber]OWK41930.1 hypothetical protein FRUB_04008 [Fimbriiglobus ruber]
MTRMHLLFLGAVLAVVLGTDPGRGDTPDPIAKKLDAAKTKYETEMKKVKADAKKYFDARAEKARNAGKDNKKLLDEVTDERKTFEELSVIRADKGLAPVARRVQVAQADVDKAFGLAADAYTKAKKDDLAAAVTREREQFFSKAAIRIAPSGNLWMSLFNGRDLTGWTGQDKGRDPIVVDKGIIKIEHKKGIESGMGTEEATHAKDMPLSEDFPVESLSRVDYAAISSSFGSAAT